MKRLRTHVFDSLYCECWRALAGCCDAGQAAGCFRSCGWSVVSDEEDVKMKQLFLLHNVCNNDLLNQLLLINGLK